MAKVSTLPTVKKGDADQIVRSLATGMTGRFFFHAHAEMRLLERDITRKQVFNVVRSGQLIDGPNWDTKEENGWKCTYNWITAGVDITVAVKLIERSDGHCDLVLTAYK